MNIMDAIESISPFTSVVLTLEVQKIVKKQGSESINPAELLIEKVETFLRVGDVPSRNITYWNIAKGADMSEVPNWKELLINEISNSKMEVMVQDLDITKEVMEVSCEISLLAFNCKRLTKELLKEIKCAKIHTASGQIEVEL